jgi:hypothetical protein
MWLLLTLLAVLLLLQLLERRNSERNPPKPALPPGSGKPAGSGQGADPLTHLAARPAGRLLIKLSTHHQAM